MPFETGLFRMLKKSVFSFATLSDFTILIAAEKGYSGRNCIMKRACFFISCVAFCCCIHVMAESEPSAVHYGQATVVTVLRIDEQCTLYCNIEGFPAIIGENMPVKINGLKTANTVEYNRKIQTYLTELILTKTDTPKEVYLKNIRRGDTFCFLGDIEIDGVDLCDLLVENGLAKRIIEVKTPASEQPSIRQAPQVSTQRTQKSGYIASKTSKIFHRTGCSHAKRIDPAKTINFPTRKEIIQTGRKPCKTCNP